MKDEEVILTVLCTAYNHGKYIRDALEGFVSQETSFRYKVLVHDDASTDETADIIREYADKYPDIIYPIYQQENQYSKGGRIVERFMVPLVEGKYIARCEGDDYWCDNNKLQTQVNFLETHPDYVACVHNTKLINMKNRKRRIMYTEFDRDIHLKDVITEGGVSYHTSSLVYKVEYLSNRPEFTTIIKGVGDYSQSIYLALSGRVKYFGKVMSCYRYAIKGSWTVRNNTLVCQINNRKSIITMLESANKYSDYKYDTLFQKAITRHELHLCALLGKRIEMKDEKYADVWASFSKKYKLYYKLASQFPILFEVKKKVLG